MNRAHAAFNTRGSEADMRMDSPPRSPPGRLASSVIGGGDAAEDAVPPLQGLANPPLHRLVKYHPILNTDREHKDSNEFRTFHHNLFHGSLRYILQSLKPGTTAPEVTLFGDGHYHHVIYGLGPYIADYPEQVLLACVVQGWCPRCTASSTDLDGLGSRRSQLHTEALFEALDHGQMWDDYGIIPGVLPFTWDFPRADIHELLLPDLLHQVIKGTFKDHLVAWVDEYLDNVHGDPPLCPAAAADEDDDGSPSNEWKIIGEVLLAKKTNGTYPRNPAALAQFLNLPDLVPLVRCFLYLQDHPDHNLNAPLPLDHCPDAPRSIRVFPSAITKFYAPSDQSGIHGMLHGRIRAANPDLPGFRGLLAARVLLFMSFKYGGITYPCTLVTWFSMIGDEPCPDVGMWMVEPDTDNRGRRVMDIIHIDTILRSEHLIDRFQAFYINKYADHHANEIVF
ncbi:hypothetical protein MSAN_00654400 [Mycena sanguinolenta]|uniref:Uncharacterized protein n=1 Tax=Mycena sanguinolenta TaxID=230812 RepID=A0A8H6Z5H8_9AGAR|nr:hypothetical protein MSAN_00654400 [Mycena sanguinolenta]